MEQQIEAYKQIGSEWQKGNHHRIYFNDLAEWLGLKCEYYNSGNVCAAWLNGEKISNSAARRIHEGLWRAKVYFDVNDGKFHGQHIDDDDFEAIVAAIKAAAQERLE